MGLAVDIDTRLKVRCTGFERVLSFEVAIDVPVSEIEGVRVFHVTGQADYAFSGQDFLG